MRGEPRGVVAYVLYNNIVVSEFELQSRYVHFRTNNVGKGKSFTHSQLWVKHVAQLFFYKDDFRIKSPTKIDMPLNKQIKTNLHGCNII